MSDAFFWLFLTVVGSAAIVGAFLSSRARERNRHELVLKLLEGGHPIDPAVLDKLLSPKPARPPAPGSPPDPRQEHRNAGFLFFLIGFLTLAFAFVGSARVSFPLIALGLVPLFMSFGVWSAGEREFRAGTLPALKQSRDPREAHQQGGFIFFMLGYGTIFWAVVRGAGISMPLIGLGLVALFMAFGVWAAGEKEFRARA